MKIVNLKCQLQGDGYYGDNISNNVKTIKTIPFKLKKENQDLEVRGRAFISKKILKY